MKRLIYIIPVLVLVLAGCNNYDIKPEQEQGFIKFYTETLTESGADVRQTSDGGYIAVGNALNEDGTNDIYLVGTDRYGNELSWSPVIIGQEGTDDVATSLQLVSDGYVILGYSKMHPDSSYDMYITKTDISGNQVWENWVGGRLDDWGSNLLIRSGGGFLASGINSSFGVGDQYAWLVVFDDAGNRVSESPAGFVGEDILSTYMVEGEHFYLMCGVLGGDNNRMVLYPVNKDDPNLVLFDKPSVTQDLVTRGMDALPDGDFLVCGFTDPSAGLNELYISRLRPASDNWQTTFSVVWEKTFTEVGDPSDFSGNAVRVIDANNIALVGTKTETGNDDLLLLLLDADGNETGRTIYGDEGFQIGEKLEITPTDGGLIIIGTNGSEDNSMISLLKTDSSGRL